MRSDWSGDLYDSVVVDSGNAVASDILLDDRQQHIYVLTSGRVRQSSVVCVSVVVYLLTDVLSFYLSQLSKVPVSSCEKQSDCQSCLTLRDPHCGWCVLEGR